MADQLGTKKCGGCQIVKDISAFGKNTARRDGLQSHCQDCKKALQLRWYARNKERHVVNVNLGRKRRSLAVRKRALEYLLEHPCVSCGESDPIVLDFDHVRGEKRDDISQMICNGLSWETILTEIDKCEVRCVRCHRIRTAKQLGYNVWPGVPREVGG